MTRTRRLWIPVFAAGLLLSGTGCMRLSHFLASSDVSRGITWGAPTDATSFPTSGVLLVHTLTGDRYCGATAITDRAVLTAAHCFAAYRSASFQIPSHSPINISSIRLHPSHFVSRSATFGQQIETADIALAFLQAPLDRIPSTAYPSLGRGAFYDEEELGAVGFGADEANRITLERKARLVYDSSLDTPLSAAGQVSFSNSLLLRSSVVGQLPCYGDSGSGVFDGAGRLVGVYSQLVGVNASLNEVQQCATARFAAYTSTAAFSSWILQQLPPVPVTCTAANRNLTPFSAGDGSIGHPYLICSPAQLDRIGTEARYLSASFVLGDDLDFSTFPGPFHMIGSYDTSSSSGSAFTGTFDGAGHVIKSLHVDANQTWIATGLFSFTDGAIIRRVNLVKVDASGMQDVAGLVGYSRASSISNCSVEGTMGPETSLPSPAGTRIAGLVGFLDSGGAGRVASITDSTTNVAVVSVDIGAGLIGYVGANGGAVTLTRVSSAGTIKNPPMAQNTYGGLIAYLSLSQANLEIRDASSSASIDVLGAFSGGFLGTINAAQSTNMVITDCHATGDVKTSGSNSGAIYSGPGPMMGGFLGTVGADASSLVLQRVYATGSVTNTNDSGVSDQGGFSGYFSVFNGGSISVTDAYSTGSVSLPNASGLWGIGGFVGAAQAGAGGGTIELKNLYTTSTVPTGFSGVGAIVGIGTGVNRATNVYWSKEVFAVADGATLDPVAGMTGHSMAELKSKSSYVGFDFTKVWAIADNFFPQLR